MIEPTSYMTTKTLYDRIGSGYSRRRNPDTRIAQLIGQALSDNMLIANVGAGTGSYEPSNKVVIAIEPSAEMIAQRTSAGGRVLRSTAENIPLRDKSVDASMAVLTIHHWRNWKGGIAELNRISRHRIAVMTWDPGHSGFWLVQRYLPEILEIDRAIFPRLEEITQLLGRSQVKVVPVPHDCSDGFLGAYWNRPQEYLDPDVRSAISTFRRVAQVEEGLAWLQAELSDGSWARMYGELGLRRELDVGYRLIIADPA